MRQEVIKAAKMEGSVHKDVPPHGLNRESPLEEYHSDLLRVATSLCKKSDLYLKKRQNTERSNTRILLEQLKS